MHVEVTRIVFLILPRNKVTWIMNILCTDLRYNIADDMSSIAMAADSTQSESVRQRKHKVKLAQQSNKDSRKQQKTAGKPNSKQVRVS